MRLTTWNSCGLKVYINDETGQYSIKNLSLLAEAIHKNHIVCIQESRLTDRAEYIIKKRWKAHFTPNQNTNGLGLGFIYNNKLENVKFGHSLDNTIAHITYTLNNYQYLLINTHLHPGSETNKKINHLREMNDVIDTLIQNNPNALLLIAGDINIALDEPDRASEALCGILEKYGLIDIYRRINPNIKKHPFFTQVPFKRQTGRPK